MDSVEEAKRLIQAGEVECVLIKDDTICAQESGRGVGPLLRMYDERKEVMIGATLVDKVIGCAAASIAICAKVKHVHGLLMSEEAIVFLDKNGITSSYTEVVHQILSRKKNGLCPLEQSVEGIADPEAALAALRERIKLLIRQRI